MKIIALPDLHGNIGAIQLLDFVFNSVDLILLVGDITSKGNEQEARKAVDVLRKYHLPILAVPGNWDSPGVDAFLTSEGINLHRKVRSVDGIQFAGLGGSIPSPSTTLFEMSESEIEMALNEMTPEISDQLPLIFVCHQPPYDTLLDQKRTGDHVGSHSVRKWIEHVQPMLCLTGHIHEGVGVDWIGKATIVNPGPAEEGHYTIIQVSRDGAQKKDLRERSRDGIFGQKNG
jgi:Icc-related predicted phosphoesterase